MYPRFSFKVCNLFCSTTLMFYFKSGTRQTPFPSQPGAHDFVIVYGQKMCTLLRGCKVKHNLLATASFLLISAARGEIFSFQNSIFNFAQCFCQVSFIVNINIHLNFLQMPSNIIQNANNAHMRTYLGVWDTLIQIWGFHRYLTCYIARDYTIRPWSGVPIWQLEEYFLRSD